MNQNHPNLKLIHEFFRIYASNEVEQLGTVLAEDIKWHIGGKQRKNPSMILQAKTFRP
ncbi:nuclear transport factor 2-like protein [Olivibacter domesticus]|uniref:Uncharacterized protein n=1 Tax=Olivibacter domesticus TaxID=407022 RepID=A0A1H7WNP6_OLID1|nr:hypothetical protein [Olivibacter domesticus]SEM23202.1 hypothetical protein SAMN05661044_04593 [Olivibacter domesticus]